MVMLKFVTKSQNVERVTATVLLKYLLTY